MSSGGAIPESPKVSIITVSLNSGRLIEDTIRSVRQQTYGNIEHLIIDGGSTDGTVDIIRRHEKEIAYWISEPDYGISDAFNKGIRAATGEIVGFLNSQDYYFTERSIERVVRAFRENPEREIIYGKTYYVPVGSSGIVGVMGEPFTREKMRKRNIIPHQSAFLRRGVFDLHGPYRLDYRFAMDYDHLLRVTSLYHPLFLDEGLAVMRLGGISDTRKFHVGKELFRAQREQGVGLPSAVATLLSNSLASAGGRLLRAFGVYTLGQFLRKAGLVKDEWR
jgi:glycosyltransferase involved in cell wall biosynthesis